MYICHSFSFSPPAPSFPLLSCHKCQADSSLSSQIVSLLRRFANCPHLVANALGSAREEVALALSQMFTEATGEVRAAAGQSFSAVTIIHVTVLHKLPWSRIWVNKKGKKEAYFLELFYELYLARGAWHQNPRKPFDVSCLP